MELDKALRRLRCRSCNRRVYPQVTNEEAKPLRYLGGFSNEESRDRYWETGLCEECQEE